MHTEIEVKFLDIDADDVRARLKHLAARLIAPERLMRRRNFESPLVSEKHAWVRVRDEAGIITLTYKQTNDSTVNGTQEINLKVDDFDTAGDFLRQIGLIEKSYQETKRESWELDGVEVEIDSWPWIPTFVELEGPDEASLKRVAGKLGMNWDAHQAGDVTHVYQKHYEFALSDLYHNQITFGPTPSWLKPK